MHGYSIFDQIPISDTYHTGNFSCVSQFTYTIRWGYGLDMVVTQTLMVRESPNL